MQSKLTPLLQARLDMLEALLQARQMVRDGKASLHEAAAALDMHPASLEAVNPEGFNLEEIAEFLDVSRQYLSTLCRDACAKIRVLHPDLREELRAA